MQSVSSRIWTRITVFISYGDNDYTTGTSSSVWSWFSLRWHPISNWPQLQLELHWPKPSVAPGYIIVSCPPVSCGRTHLPPSPISTKSTGQGDILISLTGCTCFAVLPLIYTGASLDWRLSRGSICYTLIPMLLSQFDAFFVEQFVFGFKIPLTFRYHFFIGAKSLSLEHFLGSANSQ